MLLKIISLSVVFLAIIFLVPTQKAEAFLYTPFGGQIEEYIEKSEAQCIINTCDKINEPIYDVVKNAISGPRDVFCSTIVAPLCSIVPIVGNAVCFVACVKMINDSVEDSIDICRVEEIRVGPPLPASVGILEIGKIDIKPTITIPMPLWIPDIHISIPFVNFSLDLKSLIPGLSDIIPDAKIYKYGEYKTEGNWVLGNSLNLRNLCFGEEPPSICNNPIARIMVSALSGDIEQVGKEAFDKAKERGLSTMKAEEIRKEAEQEHTASCPLLNLLHQMGTSRSAGFSL